MFKTESQIWSEWKEANAELVSLCEATEDPRWLEEAYENSVEYIEWCDREEKLQETYKGFGDYSDSIDSDRVWEVHDMHWSDVYYDEL